MVICIGVMSSSMSPAVRTFPSPSLMINIVDESKRTNRHKIGRLFFILLIIGNYNIELSRIYIVMSRSKSLVRAHI